jgi:PKD repeat protein
VNLSTDASSYLWDFGDGETDSTANPIHIYAETGTYNVVLIATNSCGSDTFSIEMVIQTSGINDPEEGVHVAIWPNPNTGNFSVDIQNFNGVVEMTMVDVTGRIVYSKSIDAPARREVSIGESIAPGLYHVVILGKDVSEVIKVIIQR